MEIEENLYNEIIDGAFAIHRKTGQGGMALVYEAEVDLGAFNYSQLYAYTQVQGSGHKERLEKSIAMSQKMNQMNLDLRTVRKILQLQNIPVPDSVVALKLANANANFDRFMAEWRSLICLNHENVIKVYGGGDYLKRPYYVMELLENVLTPRSIVRDFPLNKKIEIIVQGCKGVAYLHENGIIHRDLKPSNILTCKIGKDEYVTKVCDLGLALSEASRTIKQNQKVVVGTPHYMPPEQIDHRCETDQRSDIYGLGACLYYMVSGKKPFFERGTGKEVIRACVSKDKPISVSDLEPKVPRVLSDIINCAMRKSSVDRYQSVNEMIQDLEMFIGESNNSLKEVSSFSRLENIPTKNYSTNYRYLKYKRKTIVAKSSRVSQARLQPVRDRSSSSSSARLTRSQQNFIRESKKKSKNDTLILVVLVMALILGAAFALKTLGYLGGEGETDTSHEATDPNNKPDEKPKKVQVIGGKASSEQEDN